MKMGMGVFEFAYWQSDDTVVNLLDPKSSYYPIDPALTTWDANGWPLSLPAGGYTRLYIPSTDKYTRPGRYRVTAKGSGTLYLVTPSGALNATVVSPGPGLDSVVGEFDVTSQGIGTLRIFATDPNDHLRDVKIFRVGQDPSKTFTSEYLAEIGQFAVLRFPSTTIASSEVDWPTNPDDPFGPVAKWKGYIELCNATNRDAWVMVPHKASDGYIGALAGLFAANLHPGLKVYLEYSDEIWNWGPLFNVATKYVDDWTQARFPGMGYGVQSGHVLLASHMHDVFAAAAPDVKLVRVICNQHASPDNFRQNLDVMKRKSVFHPGRDIRFDAVATAPYADPAQYLDFGFMDSKWAAGEKDAVMDHIFQGYGKCMPDLDAAAQQYKSLADANGMRLICYEMAPGWCWFPAFTAARQEYFLASYRDPRMKTFLSTVYFPWLAKYYDLAMYTQHDRIPSNNEDWGVRSHATEMPCPKLDACLEWCAAHNSEPDPVPPPAPPPDPTPGVSVTPLVDGGFEQVQVGAGQFVYRPGGSPWTFTADAGLAANGSGFTTGNPAAPEGTQVAFIQNAGTATQGIGSLEPGNYVVKLKAAQRGNWGGAQSLQVLLDGNPIGTINPVGTSYADYQTPQFTIAGHVIQIKGAGAAGDNTAFVDAVQIVKVS